ncbi:MAG: hypothetical protein R3E68_21430 [Burkholderiaceae bacterium]
MPAFPDQRTALGFGYMPEDRRLIPLLTVEENMLPAWVNKSIDGARVWALRHELMPELREMRSRKACNCPAGSKAGGFGPGAGRWQPAAVWTSPSRGGAGVVATASEVIASLRARKWRS